MPLWLCSMHAPLSHKGCPNLPFTAFGRHLTWLISAQEHFVKVTLWHYFKEPLCFQPLKSNQVMYLTYGLRSIPEPHPTLLSGLPSHQRHTVSVARSKWLLSQTFCFMSSRFTSCKHEDLLVCYTVTNDDNCGLPSLCCGLRALSAAVWLESWVRLLTDERFLPWGSTYGFHGSLWIPEII